MILSFPKTEISPYLLHTSFNSKLFYSWSTSNRSCNKLISSLSDIETRWAADIALLRFSSTSLINCSRIRLELLDITKKPLPCRLVINPSPSNSLYARVVVRTLIFKSFARCLREGRASFSVSSPDRICSFTCSFICA